MTEKKPYFRSVVVDGGFSILLKTSIALECPFGMPT